jgi:hypothetical protein
MMRFASWHIVTPNHRHVAHVSSSLERPTHHPPAFPQTPLSWVPSLSSSSCSCCHWTDPKFYLIKGTPPSGRKGRQHQPAFQLRQSHDDSPAMATVRNSHFTPCSASLPHTPDRPGSRPTRRQPSPRSGMRMTCSHSRPSAGLLGRVHSIRGVSFAGQGRCRHGPRVVRLRCRVGRHAPLADVRLGHQRKRRGAAGRRAAAAAAAASAEGGCSISRLGEERGGRMGGCWISIIVFAVTSIKRSTITRRGKGGGGEGGTGRSRGSELLEPRGAAVGCAAEAGCLFQAHRYIYGFPGSKPCPPLSIQPFALDTLGLAPSSMPLDFSVSFPLLLLPFYYEKDFLRRGASIMQSCLVMYLHPIAGFCSCFLISPLQTCKELRRLLGGVLRGVTLLSVTDDTPDKSILNLIRHCSALDTLKVATRTPALVYTYMHTYIHTYIHLFIHI